MGQNTCSCFQAPRNPIEIHLEVQRSFSTVQGITQCSGSMFIPITTYEMTSREQSKARLRAIKQENPSRAKQQEACTVENPFPESVKNQSCRFADQHCRDPPNPRRCPSPHLINILGIYTPDCRAYFSAKKNFKKVKTKHVTV